MSKGPVPADRCPNEDSLLAFVQGFLPPAEAEAVETHVADCDACRHLVAEAATELLGEDTGQPAVHADGSSPAAPPATLAPGARVGRYSILELVGRGAMGAVFAAYDPELDRRIALKVLRPDRRIIEARATLRERLVREGQTMARLSHPNVVAVHDVTAVGDAVYLAMDFIEGQTLREWLAEKPRGWSEIVKVFVEAGRGIEAAHKAAIVHRDFKPDNVLVAHDGRILVTDFGLARLGQATDLHASADGPRLPQSTSLTSTGTVVGTPAYMAPEQFTGERASAAADVYAYCSALYQALVGEHPFGNRADDYQTFRKSVLTEPLRRPKAFARLPVQVRQALERGLVVDPAKRPAMTALLALLTSDPARRRRNLALAAGAVMVLGAAGVVAFTRGGPEALCKAGPARLATAWGPARRAAIEAAFAATGASYAADTARAVIRQLDEYGSAWESAYTEACSATHVRGEQSASLLDLRMQCLDQRLRELGATGEALAKLDKEALDRALLAASSLTDVAVCADRESLTAEVPPPTGPARKIVEAAGEELARARALAELGRYADAQPVAERALAGARQAAYAPLESEALLVLESLHDKGGRPAVAAKTAELAIMAAARGRHSDARVRAMTHLGALLGLRGNAEEGLRWCAVAESEVRGANKLLRRADIHRARGLTLSKAKRPVEAVAETLASQVLYTKALGADDPRVAAAYNQYSTALNDMSQYAESKTWAARALAVTEAALGPEHPETGRYLWRLAIVEGYLRQRHEAVQHLRRALAITEKALGPTNVRTGYVLMNLGTTLMNLGETAEGLEHLERSARIKEQALGAEHPDAQSAIALLAWAYGRVGRLEEGEAAARRVLALSIARVGEEKSFIRMAILAEILWSREKRDEACSMIDHALELAEKGVPHVREHARMLAMQGDCAQWRGDLARAQSIQERALSMVEKADGPNGVDVADRVIDLAGVLLARGKTAEAVAAYERAVALRRQGEASPDAVAKAEFLLGLALRAAGQDARAAPLLDKAGHVLIDARDVDPDLARQVRRTVGNRR